MATGRARPMDDVLEQLRKLRRTMLADVHELESGLRRLSEKRDGEWKLHPGLEMPAPIAMS